MFFICNADSGVCEYASGFGSSVRLRALSRASLNLSPCRLPCCSAPYLGTVVIMYDVTHLRITIKYKENNVSGVLQSEWHGEKAVKIWLVKGDDAYVGEVLNHF